VEFWGFLVLLLVGPVLLALAILGSAVVRTGASLGSRGGPGGWGRRGLLVWLGAAVLTLAAILGLLWAGRGGEEKDDDYLGWAWFLSVAVVVSAPALIVVFFAPRRWRLLPVLYLVVLGALLLGKLWAEVVALTVLAYGCLITFVLVYGVAALSATSRGGRARPKLK
jgi:hypothetical protein